MKDQARLIYSGLLGVAIVFAVGNPLQQQFGHLSVGQAMPISSRAANIPKICLPDGIQLMDVVSADPVPGKDNKIKTVTVKEKLRQLNVICRNRQLIDQSGRAVRFYRLQGCWGNPPSNYSEILKRQATAIRKLQSNFTVIEMTCNPSGIPYP